MSRNFYKDTWELFPFVKNIHIYNKETFPPSSALRFSCLADSIATQSKGRLPKSLLYHANFANEPPLLVPFEFVGNTATKVNQTEPPGKVRPCEV